MNESVESYEVSAAVVSATNSSSKESGFEMKTFWEKMRHL
jgi:hypothetical protein